MLIKRFTNLCICCVLLLSVMAASCQKDTGEEQVDQKKALLRADSALNALTSPGNFLAASGKLTFKVQDSTYTFDAATDSIAFVNMIIDNDRYFGITAINKAHTMSFGISSKGYAISKVKKTIAGGQLLFRPDAIHTDQYTLTRYANPGDAGKIKLSAYRQKNVLAKGTFFTFLSKGDDVNSPFARVEGSFDLRLK
jgi:hypothetical protein